MYLPFLLQQDFLLEVWVMRAVLAARVRDSRHCDRYASLARVPLPV